MARPVAHSRLCEIRFVSQGRAGVLCAARRIRNLPAVHVQPAAVAVPAVVQLFPRRGRVLPHGPRARVDDQLPRHDPTDAPLVLVPGAGDARAPGRVLRARGHDSAAGHVLLRHRLPRRDHRRMARAGLPGPRRAQTLPRSAHAAPGRRDADYRRALPAAALHHLRPKQVRSQIPHLQAQPERDAQLDRHPRRPGHSHRRRLVEGLHGAPHQARLRVLGRNARPRRLPEARVLIQRGA
mmetsp:Transcript_8741/g.28747  ORF Transcript_8741/g.28747 Transcript_8741/m.28747 type:complete len:238 (-) Transcript_8741:32-745(-)